MHFGERRIRTVVFQVQMYLFIFGKLDVVHCMCGCQKWEIQLRLGWKQVKEPITNEETKFLFKFLWSLVWSVKWNAPYQTSLVQWHVTFVLFPSMKSRCKVHRVYAHSVSKFSEKGHRKLSSTWTQFWLNDVSWYKIILKSKIYSILACSRSKLQ